MTTTARLPALRYSATNSELRWRLAWGSVTEIRPRRRDQHRLPEFNVVLVFRAPEGATKHVLHQKVNQSLDNCGVVQASLAVADDRRSITLVELDDSLSTVDLDEYVPGEINPANVDRLFARDEFEL